MNKATKEEIEKWREEDFWNRMDFNPAWIFILPTAPLKFVGELASSDTLISIFFDDTNCSRT